MLSSRFILALLLLLALASPAWGAVTVNTLGSASTTTPVSPQTFSNVVNIPNTTGISVIGIMDGSGDTTSAVTGVTLGGATVTKLIARNSNDQTAGGVWLGYVLNSTIGSTGLKNLVVTFDATVSASLIGGVVCLDGQHASTPLGTAVSAIGTATPITITVTDSVAGDMVVDAVANGSAITSSSQTEQWHINVNTSSAAGNGGQATAAGAASVTMAWTVTSDWWASTAVTVKQAAAGGAATPQRTLTGVGQ